MNNFDLKIVFEVIIRIDWISQYYENKLCLDVLYGNCTYEGAILSKYQTYTYITGH